MGRPSYARMDKPEAYPTGKMKVCALIPAYNEAPHIAAVARGAARYVAEVVVIDDGSTDGTYEEAAGAGATCLRMPRNQGKAVALRAGLVYAQARDFTHVLTLDGDGQHLPEDIPAPALSSAGMSSGRCWASPLTAG